MTSRMTREQASQLSAAEQHEWFRRATSRRSLLRGGAIGAGAAIAGPALLAGTADASTTRSVQREGHTAPGHQGRLAWRKLDQPPFGRHIAYGADPMTQMSVAWQVAAPVSNPFIRVGASPLGSERSHRGRGTQPGHASVQHLGRQRRRLDHAIANRRSTINQYYVHAQLTGLRPGTTYYYSLGHQGWDFIRRRHDATFSTAPARPQPVHLHRLRRPGGHLRCGGQHEPDQGPEPGVPLARG